LRRFEVRTGIGNVVTLVGRAEAHPASGTPHVRVWGTRGEGRVQTSASARDVIRSAGMSKRPAKARADAAPALSIPERILLFCVASGTDWEHAGVTGATVTATIVRGLIQRDPAGRLWLTKEGRAILAALAKGGG
jgi:hypothetical protein